MSNKIRELKDIPTKQVLIPWNIPEWTEEEREHYMKKQMDGMKLCLPKRNFFDKLFKK